MAAYTRSPVALLLVVLAGCLGNPAPSATATRYVPSGDEADVDGGSNPGARDAGSAEEVDAGSGPQGRARERLEWRQAGGEPGRTMWSLSAAPPSYVPLWEVQITTAPAWGQQPRVEAMERAPLVLGDTVLASGDTAVVALDLFTGAEKWRISEQTVRADGVLTQDTAILALAGVMAVAVADGGVRWHRRDLRATTALLWDGELVFVGAEAAAADAGTVVALDPVSGETRREASVSSRVDSLAVCDGNVVAATGDGRLIAWDRTLATVRWERQLVTGVRNWWQGIRCADGRIALIDERSDRLFVLRGSDGTTAFELAANRELWMVVGGGLLAMGSHRGNQGPGHMRVIDLQSGDPRWSVEETAWPVAVLDGSILANRGDGSTARTVLLDALTGEQVGETVYNALAYDTAIACGKLIGGGRGASIPGPTFRVLGDPAGADLCEWSTAY